jgi:hypothetical protein
MLHLVFVSTDEDEDVDANKQVIRFLSQPFHFLV